VQLQQLERPHFFNGKLLTAEDLQREQDYHRNKARLHNRFLHGWGVVQGLSVSLDQGSVVVSPGLALDCAGNELILPQEERLSLVNLVGRQWVVVRYVELPIGQVPSPNGNVEPSRVHESMAVELSSSNPLVGHGGQLTRRVGCGVNHGLSLAIVTKRGTRWRVISVKSSVRCHR
jgi:hypothetical protein